MHTFKHYKKSHSCLENCRFTAKPAIINRLHISIDAKQYFVCIWNQLIMRTKCLIDLAEGLKRSFTVNPSVPSWKSVTVYGIRICTLHIWLRLWRSLKPNTFQWIIYIQSNTIYNVMQLFRRNLFSFWIWHDMMINTFYKNVFASQLWNNILVINCKYTQSHLFLPLVKELFWL